MKPIERRVAQLEEAARGRAGAHDAEAAEAAHTELSDILSALAAEKSAGDVHGSAQRLLDGVLAAMGRRA
jgi:hypothetical protein